MDIAGLTLQPDQLWQITGIAFALALFLLWMRRWLDRRKLFKLCGVPASSFKLMGTTLMWFGRPVRFRKNGVQGTPSTVFLKKNGKTVYVCQVKPRDYKGRVKVRERYEMLLFMGLANERYNPEKTKGAILFRDHLEPIKYEPVIYNQLMELQNEYREAIKEWKAPNVRPLFNRDQPF